MLNKLNLTRNPLRSAVESKKTFEPSQKARIYYKGRNDVEEQKDLKDQKFEFNENNLRNEPELYKLSKSSFNKNSPLEAETFYVSDKEVKILKSQWKYLDHLFMFDIKIYVTYLTRENQLFWSYQTFDIKDFEYPAEFNKKQSKIIEVIQRAVSIEITIKQKHFRNIVENYYLIDISRTFGIIHGILKRNIFLNFQVFIISSYMLQFDIIVEKPDDHKIKNFNISSEFEMFQPIIDNEKRTFVLKKLSFNYMKGIEPEINLVSDNEYTVKFYNNRMLINRELKRFYEFEL